MSKMTDKEIIKALECHADENNSCNICTYNSEGCSLKLCRDALDLINRQQAEIEKLNVELVGMRGACNSYKMHYDNAIVENEELRAINESLKRDRPFIKAEAIKELEAKIHEKLHEAEMHGNFEPVVTREMFDSVVKEMVGEGK